MKSKLLIFVLALCFCSGSILAQSSSGVSKRGTTAAPFLSIAQGARALGLGGAFVAVADDPSAMYWNPSGIADLQGFHFLVDHTSWVADVSYDYIGATVGLGALGGLGVNLTASNIADMKVTTVDMQEGTGEVFGVSDLAVGLTYALKLTDQFAVGFNPKYVYQKIWKMSATAFALDIGVKYQTPFEGITLGMAITNFGSKMRMEGNNALVLYDQDPGNTGINTRIPANLATDEWDLPLNFRVGIAYTASLGIANKITFAVDAAHPSDNYESVNVGGEYVFEDVLYFRGGMKSLFLKDSEESFTLGVGFKQLLLGNLQFNVDYAYQDLSRLKSVQKFTIGVSF
jgi:Type IX secretion system protein PorV